MNDNNASLNISVQAGVARLQLNRPDLHNAFDDVLISALTDVLEGMAKDATVQVLVLGAEGVSFSAGADLGWMRRMAAASEMDNRADSERLAALMRTLAFFPKPTLALVNGAAYGGGVGLIACCDIAIAADHARFGLTEAKLGLAPAVISPYVIDAIGPRQARRWFQTAEIFDAAQALRMNLVHELVPATELEAAGARVLKSLMQNGPHAVAACKQLVDRMAGRDLQAQMMLDRENAALIARLRVSTEGQEGLNAFLEKRRPAFKPSTP